MTKKEKQLALGPAKLYPINTAQACDDRDHQIVKRVTQSLSREQLLEIGQNGHYKNWGIDPECFELCVALNKIPELQTLESCCGHGTEKFSICFVVDSLQPLQQLMAILSSYGGHNNSGSTDWWHIRVDIEYWAHKRRIYPIVFELVGPIGAYSQAMEIATLINAQVQND